MMVLQPLKNTQSLVEKSLGPMKFDEKIMGGNKIKNPSIVLEAKLSLCLSLVSKSM